MRGFRAILIPLICTILTLLFSSWDRRSVAAECSAGCGMAYPRPSLRPGIWKRSSSQTGGASTLPARQQNYTISGLKLSNRARCRKSCATHCPALPFLVKFTANTRKGFILSRRLSGRRRRAGRKPGSCILGALNEENYRQMNSLYSVMSISIM